MNASFPSPRAPWLLPVGDKARFRSTFGSGAVSMVNKCSEPSFLVRLLIWKPVSCPDTGSFLCQS